MASKGKATGKTPSEPQGIPDDGIEVTSAETHDIAGPVTENDGNVPSHAGESVQIAHNGGETGGELSAVVPVKPAIKGRFVVKGQSGNPGGRVKNNQNHATKIQERIRIAESMIEGQLEAVIGSVVQKALDGDMVAAKVLLDRIIPAVKSRPVTFNVPKMNNANDIAKAVAGVIEGVASGIVTPDEGATIAGMFEIKRKYMREYMRKWRAKREES